MFLYLPDSLSEIYSDIPCTSHGVNFTFCMQFTGEVTSEVVEINMIGYIKQWLADWDSFQSLGWGSRPG